MRCREPGGVLGGREDWKPVPGGCRILTTPGAQGDGMRLRPQNCDRGRDPRGKGLNLDGERGRTGFQGERRVGARPQRGLCSPEMRVWV